MTTTETVQLTIETAPGVRRTVTLPLPQARGMVASCQARGMRVIVTGAWTE